MFECEQGKKERKFNFGLKVPQIGWNRVKVKSLKLKVKSLFQSIPQESYFYFVNSYYCLTQDKSVIVGTSDYGEKFCSVLLQENICGVQFHPEKSSTVGRQFLQNWAQLW